MPGISPIEAAIFVAITVAILVRITVNRQMVDAYRERYHAVPDWRWLWTPVDDPAIEKLRRRAAIGPLAAGIGVTLLFVVLVSKPA